MKKGFHKQITDLAIGCALNSKDVDKTLGAERENLGLGSLFEDDIERGLQRLTNWHFYGRRMAFFPCWPISRNSLRRLHKLSAQLNDPEAGANHDAGERAVLIGRILHHIQDMSCPPHVVPVYHMTDDLYEAHMPPIVTAPENYDLKAIKDIDALYNESARETLDLVRKTPIKFDPPHEGPESITLSSFWMEPDSRWRFWGIYGIDGEDRFYSDFIKIGESTLRVAPGFYDDVYKLFADKAVIESARLLVHLYKGF